ncbi:D-alanyl-D-alanine carboxypeptidase [Streptomyces sp. NPDC050315]|uniref:D-alanyl-D-alanine carboxypeptidase family protein n=1 Tax=Streptomyces sp. NPDC050315 TaxID=3155039 RepID=UPI00343BE091
MKEIPVAGESPDRSEQKQSSGETAESERDPRLAVLRDAPTDTETSGKASESGEASEEASTEPPTETPAEPDSVAATGEKSDSDSEGDRDGREGGRDGGEEGGQGGEGGEGGDARLKAAVAAWVAGKDASDAPGDAGDAESAESSEGAPEGASDTSEASEGGDAAEGKSEGKGEGEAGAETGGAAEADPEAESALPVRKPGGKAKKGAAQPDQPTAVFGTVAPKPAPADDATRVFAAVKPKGEKKASAEATEKAAEKDPESGAKKDAEARKATAAAIPKRSEIAKKAEAAATSKDKDTESTGSEAKKDAKADAKTGAAKKDAEDSKASEDNKAPKAAEKPGKEDAKQPGKEKDDAEKSGKGKGALERDAERTSQFVALKSADERPVKPPKPVGKEVAKPSGKPGAAPLPPAAEAPAPASPSPQPAAQPSAAAQPPSAAPEGAPLPESERTKQQPLPPLDLLAQLTNTPPPPETPIRTIVRRFKIWTPLVLLLLLVFVIVQAVRPLPDPTLALTSDATYSFDGGKPSLPWPTEGQAYVEVSGLGPIGSYGEQKPIPIGSVAKTMTAYIIMRDHPLKPGKKGDMIRVDKQAEEDGKKGAGHGDESVLDTVKEGDYISQKDALSAVMIPSANNIARLLARWDAGSQEAFVKKMNATAKDLGMKNTTYTDPSGLIETTVSTAQDQVKLGKKAMEIRSLVDITKLPTWTDPSGKTWRNFNTLPPYNNAIGLKTGSTSKAGGNLLFAGTQQVGDTTQLIVGAVLGQHRPPIIDTANAISKDLLTTTQGALEDRTVVKEGDVVGVVDDGLGGTTPVVATEDLKAVGWNGLTVKLGLTDKGKAIPHTAKAGTKVGVLTAGSGPGQATVPVALQKDLAEPTFGAKLTRVG